MWTTDNSFDLLGDVVEDHGIECMNYCAMPNDYHATLRPTRPNLSEALDG